MDNEIRKIERWNSGSWNRDLGMLHTDDLKRSTTFMEKDTKERKVLQRAICVNGGAKSWVSSICRK